VKFFRTIVIIGIVLAGSIGAYLGGEMLGRMAYADGIASVDAGPAPPAEGIATSPAVADRDVKPDNVAPPAIADPVAAPADFVDDVRGSYQKGGWLAVTLALIYGLLLVLQRWIAYLRTGWRKVVIASALTALLALIAALSNGDPPSLALVANVIGAAVLLAIKTGAASGEAAT
jgi:hypothetical protein